LPYIHIDSETARFMAEYAQATGLTVERSVKEALGEWGECFGEPVIIFASTHKADNQFPTNPILPSRKRRAKRISAANVISIDTSRSFAPAHSIAQY
jgi:hypothetical protein